MQNTSFDWNFKTIRQKGINGRIEFIPQGRFLGGSSTMNGIVII